MDLMKTIILSRLVALPLVVAAGGVVCAVHGHYWWALTFFLLAVGTGGTYSQKG